MGEHAYTGMQNIVLNVFKVQQINSVIENLRIHNAWIDNRIFLLALSQRK